MLLDLAATASPAEQETILLGAYAANCFEFFEAVKLAADPFIVFGVTKVAEILDGDDADGTFAFADFRRLCELLSSGALTDEAARLAIRRAAEFCHVPTWNLLYRRVLLKNLAVDTAVVGRVFAQLKSVPKRFLIPRFHCQMATATKKLPSGIRLLDVQLTGTRLLAVLGSRVSLFTADGVLYPCADLEQVLRPLASHLPAPLVLDGVQVGTGDYVLFDLIPFNEFRDRLCRKKQRERRFALESLQRTGAFGETRRVRVLPQVEIDFRTADGQTAFGDFNRRAIEHGYSAIVLKNPEANYVCKRTTAWMIRKSQIIAMNT